MTTIVDWQIVNGDNVSQTLTAALAKLSSGESEVLLDFSAVQRISPAALLAFEDLAAAAEKKSVKVALRRVNVGVYKVLKLSRLAARFSFVN